MKAPTRSIKPKVIGSEAWRTGKRRQIEPREAIVFRWPSKTSIAEEYIQDWEAEACRALHSLRISTSIVKAIGRFVSRKTGTATVRNQTLSGVTDRAVKTIELDLSRLRTMGFLTSQIKRKRDENGRLVTERILQISHPKTDFPSPTREEFENGSPDPYTPKLRV